MINDNKHKQIAHNNTHKNTGHIRHTYDKGNIVFQLKRGIKRKDSKHKSDPYKITEVYTNGTVTIIQGAKRHQITIRNIEPYVTK